MKKATAGLLAGVIMVMSATSAFAGDAKKVNLNKLESKTRIVALKIDPENTLPMADIKVVAAPSVAAITKVADTDDTISITLTNIEALTEGHSKELKVMNIVPATAVEMNKTVIAASGVTPAE